MQYCVRIYVAQRFGPPLQAPPKISWFSCIVLRSERVWMKIQETSVDLDAAGIRRIGIRKILGSVDHPF